MISCRSEVPELEEALRAVTGAGTTDITWNAPPASRSTGLLVGGGNCTATAIARNVVVTAAHCFNGPVGRGELVGGTRGGTLDGSSVFFVLPYLDGGGVQQMAIVRGIPGGVHLWAHEDRFENIGEDGRDASIAGSDLAVVVLSRPLTPTELPQPMNVYTAADLYTHLKNPGTGFVQGPYEVTGYEIGRAHV